MQDSGIKQEGISMEIDTYIPVTKAKSALLDMIRVLADQEDIIAITKNGIPRAVLMSMAQYESMRETMEILGDEQMMRQIQQSRDEIKAGKQLVDLGDL